MTILNDQLTAELERGATIHGTRSLAAAARRLRTSAVEDLRVMSSLVLRLSKAGPLLPAYDLRPASPRRSTAFALAHRCRPGPDNRTAGRRTDADRAAAARARQQHGVRRPPVVNGPPTAGGEGPLDEPASKQVMFAAQWTHTAEHLGDHRRQLAGADPARPGGQGAERRRARLGADAAGSRVIGYLTRSAQRLRLIVRMTADNLGAGRQQGTSATLFVEPTGQPFEPVPPRLRSPRVQVEAASGESSRRPACWVRSAVGPSLPSQLVTAGRLPRGKRARGDAALQQAPRPNHPAVFPGRQEQRLPRRRRRRASARSELAGGRASGQATPIFAAMPRSGARSPHTFAVEQVSHGPRAIGRFRMCWAAMPSATVSALSASSSRRFMP